MKKKAQALCVFFIERKKDKRGIERQRTVEEECKERTKRNTEGNYAEVMYMSLENRC